MKLTAFQSCEIGVSVLRKDYDTAGSVIFLLGIGEILEGWTHKKSVDDLARSMSLHMENVIPFDGTVMEGEALVNQASLTGESLPVRKTIEGYVYAGTILEEGELTICVKEVDTIVFDKTGTLTKAQPIVADVISFNG